MFVITQTPKSSFKLISDTSTMLIICTSATLSTCLTKPIILNPFKDEYMDHVSTDSIRTEI